MSVIESKNYKNPFVKRKNLGSASSERLACFGCGSNQHLKNNCPKLVRKSCTFCKKNGHEESECWLKPKMTAAIVPSGHIQAIIGGKKIKMLVDTGSEVSLLKYCNITSNMKFMPCHQLLRGFDGNEKFSIGLVHTNVSFTGLDLDIILLVLVDTDLIEDGIFGRDFLCKPNLKLQFSEKGVHLTVIPFDVATVNSDEFQIKSDLAEVENQNKLIAVLKEFEEIVAVDSNIRSVNTGELFIQLSDDTPIVRRPYRMSAQERDVVKDIIQDLLKNKIIRESESPYASPILLVTKKNGQQRMCIDFRALNAITVKDRYPLPLIDDQLDALAGAK